VKEKNNGIKSYNMTHYSSRKRGKSLLKSITMKKKFKIGEIYNFRYTSTPIKSDTPVRILSEDGNYAEPCFTSGCFFSERNHLPMRKSDFLFNNGYWGWTNFNEHLERTPFCTELEKILNGTSNIENGENLLSMLKSDYGKDFAKDIIENYMKTNKIT